MIDYLPSELRSQSSNSFLVTNSVLLLARSFDKKMAIEIYTFATLLDPRYKAAGFICREKAQPQAAKEFLISKLEDGFRQKSNTIISADSDVNQAGKSDTDDSVRAIDDDAATWKQLLRFRYLNNVVRTAVA